MGSETQHVNLDIFSDFLLFSDDSSLLQGLELETNFEPVGRG